MSNQRAIYRIEFPPEDRPKFVTGRSSYSIINLSEEGVLLQTPPAFVYDVGDIVQGKVRLVTGESIPVAGEVWRHEAAEVVILLTQKIPLKVVLTEQRRLIQKYGDLVS